MPQISVIVPVYKAEAFLDRCVNSILNQSFTDFELILVDDGSPDRSGEICEEYAKQDNRIHVFHKENGGQATARNLAIEWTLENSDSQWLVFVDSDDWVHKDYLKVLLNSATEWNVKVAICDFAVTETFSEDLNLFNVGVVKIDAENAIAEHYTACMAPWGKIYAKELFATLRFVEVRAYEDAFITHIPILKAGQIVLTDAQLYYYFENPESTTRKKWTERNLVQIKAHEARVNYCQENGYDTAYKRELEAYVISIYTQAAELVKIIKENPMYQNFLREIRPKLLPTLRLARSYGLFPYCEKYVWIYELAYPVKPIWALRNIMKKVIHN